MGVERTVERMRTMLAPIWRGDVLSAGLHRLGHGGQPEFCDHMMTGLDEVTVNREPVLIITGVCFWIWLSLSQSLLLFLSQHSDDMSLHGCEATVCCMGRGPELLNTK
ncbi:unnamed protein product [Tetraodon nigroviridis]|uniref:(spotted green pufferfish) hypothetical protein n=1 Tax=Tetraodon nigroviridis TaxID=99883 RepID=Q4S7B0_TETNG|nr:unnamed protein product [Tetraodon nigroviridis]